MPDLSKYKKRILIITGLGTFMGTLDSSIVNVSLPTLSRELGASIDMVGWVVLSYAMTIFSLLMVFGALSEKKGYQFSYKYGFSIFLIGSVLCGISTSIYMLIISRVLQGVGAALMISVGPALVTSSFPPEERGRGLSINVMVVSIGLMLGPPLGGFIVSYLGWRWIFYVNLPVCLLGIYLTGKFIGDYPITNPIKKIGLFSAVTLFLTLLTIMLSLLLFSKQMLTGINLAMFILLALIFLATFLYNESRSKNCLIGIDLFKNKIFIFSGLSMLLIFIGLISISILLPFYLEEIKGLTPDKVGFYLMTVPLSMFIFSRPAGYLADKFPARIISTIGASIILGGLIIFLNLKSDSSMLTIISGLILAGVGMGLFSTPNTSAVMGSVNKYQRGSASGMIATIRTLGIALGAGFSIAIFSYFQNTYLNNNVESVTAFMESYQNVYKIMAFAIASGLIFSAIRGDNHNSQNKSS